MALSSVGLLYENSGYGIRQSVLLKDNEKPAPLLQNNAKNVDLAISTVFVKNGELKAYTLITRSSQNTVSVEQISETQS
ncbi:MAG: hypothetical protein ACI4KR_04670 [Ruminiclostridium sp.]